MNALFQDSAVFRKKGKSLLAVMKLKPAGLLDRTDGPVLHGGGGMRGGRGPTYNNKFN